MLLHDAQFLRVRFQGRIQVLNTTNRALLRCCWRFTEGRGGGCHLCSPRVESLLQAGAGARESFVAQMNDGMDDSSLGRESDSVLTDSDRMDVTSLGREIDSLLTDSDRILKEELGNFVDFKHRRTFGSWCLLVSDETQLSWFREFFLDRNVSRSMWTTFFSVRREVFVWMVYEMAVWSTREASLHPDSVLLLNEDVPLPEQLGATLFQLKHACALQETADKFGIKMTEILSIMQNCLQCIVNVFGNCVQDDSHDALDVDRLTAQSGKVWGLGHRLGVVGFTTVYFSTFRDHNVPRVSCPQPVTLMVVDDAIGFHHLVRPQPHDILGGYSHAQVLWMSSFVHPPNEDGNIHGNELCKQDYFVDLPSNSLIWSDGPLEFRDRPQRQELTSLPTSEEENELKSFTMAVNVVRKSLEDLCDTFQVLHGNFFCAADDDMHICIRATLILHNIMRMERDEFLYYFGSRDHCRLQ